MDKASHIYKHLMSLDGSWQKYTPDCFSIIDQSTNILELKIKETIHILWEKPSLNQQHLYVTLRLKLSL